MALLQPKQKREKTPLRFNIDANVAEEIRSYCDYAGFTKIEEFIEEAALHILNKDKAFKEWKDRQKIA
ncbi:MAG: hypothetical protein ABI296_04880 [Gammaproteobacteria bacterium]